MASSIIPIGTECSAALHALVRKRAELDGELEQHQGRIRELQKAIQNLDAVLVLIKPDIDISQIAAKRVRPPHSAAPGEIKGIVVDCLREAEGPLTSRALARAVVESRELDLADAKLEVTMARRVRACLRPLRLAGRVRAVPMPAGPQGWVLATKHLEQAEAVRLGVSR
ncbi:MULTISPECIES: hypothetical protein [Brevundimonas]|uniref:hypothetical protein n=1 Tax=Brevundimonas TaxID=41275 RepID=UPI000627B0D8|nr:MULTISPECIES: hypothetical protein [Brevundimonas]MBN9479520.1 hypothetical protein [Bordetella sp.]OMG58393.1 hypothetical protein BJP32_09630 [Brevundimonas sp. ZS04]